MNFTKNIFDLTDEQVELSKQFYNGKVIKCLVAPYHTYKQLEELLPYTKTTYLFPEREMNQTQILHFISMVLNTNPDGEIRIITVHQNIITDMIDGCVRILTESSEIVESPIKTLMANIHDVRYKILENDDFKSPKNENGETEQGKKVITDIFDYLKENKNKTIPRKEYLNVKNKIEIVGDRLIRTRLEDMLDEVKCPLSNNEKKAIELEKEAERLRNND